MSKQKIPPEALKYFQETGRQGGKIGGKKAALNMTPAERTARAKKAAKASARVRSAAARRRAAKKAGEDPKGSKG